MKVLITGGAGFIGSHLADRLLARRDQVFILDNLATGRLDNLNPQDGLTIVRGDIAERRDVDRAFDEFRPDIVIHAAASYKNPDDWVSDTKTNVLGTSHIVQAARRVKVSRLVYFQTALCYGLRPRVFPIPIDHPLCPENSSYAISKTAGEQYIRISDLDYISFRLANIIGPRNLSGPVAAFFHRLTKNKPIIVMESRRDFVFVLDLVDLVMAAVDGKAIRGVYHAASGGSYSIREVFELVVKAMGTTLMKEVKVRPPNADDSVCILLDPSKTARMFGWMPSTPLETAVAAAVTWYKQHGVAQPYTHLKFARPD